MHLTNISITFLWVRAVFFYQNWSRIWNLDTLIFHGILWPQQPRRSNGKPKILLWILMGKKGKNLVYLHVKLSILNIGGASRLIFINTTKCPLIPAIKNWSVVLQSYEIKSPPWTILGFRILGIFSVENIYRLGVFMFQTWDNSQLCIDSQYSSQ